MCVGLCIAVEGYVQPWRVMYSRGGLYVGESAKNGPLVHGPGP